MLYSARTIGSLTIKQIEEHLGELKKVDKKFTDKEALEKKEALDRLNNISKTMFGK